jgi:anti-anti-sigma factor
MALTIESNHAKDGSLVVGLRGELILGPGCHQLAEYLHQQLRPGLHLVFDVAGVSQLDSTGIGLFIDAYSRLEKGGGKMTIAGAVGPVREAFRVTRLDTVFHFTPAVADAI